MPRQITKEKPDPNSDLDLEEDSNIIDPEDEEQVKRDTIHDPTEEFESNVSDFEYNNKSEMEYIKNKFAVPDKLRRSQERQFLAEVDTSKGEIEREITKMLRIRAPDVNDPKRKQKEFLIYYENWYGKNWLDKKIAPVTDHLEGEYQKLEREPITERNRIVGWKMRKGPIAHYITFDKDTVDKIIADSIGSDKETIQYQIRNGNMRYGFEYDDFVSKSFEDLIKQGKKG